jgi:hypothetical protein
MSRFVHEVSRQRIASDVAVLAMLAAQSSMDKPSGSSSISCGLLAVLVIVENSIFERLETLFILPIV